MSGADGGERRASPEAGAAFQVREHDRAIVFGAGALDAAEALVPGPFTLLTTARAAATPIAAPLVARAALRVDVPAGLVEDVAAALRAQVAGAVLVALGGGRVIDVAKALAAADPPRRVVAVPTTLSAAELSGRHRHARGVAPETPHARAAAVLNDPALSASAPPEQLAASSANALGHALVAAALAQESPLAAAVARDAAAHLAVAWALAPGAAALVGPGAAPTAGAHAAPTAAGPAGGTPGAPDRAGAALGALLAGWALDHAGIGLHHVLSQTAVRVAGLGHAEANATLLPATAAALRRRTPRAFAVLDAQLGATPEAVAAGLRARAGLDVPGPLSGDDALLDRLAEAAARRPELARLAPPPDAAELRALYAAAAAGG